MKKIVNSIFSVALAGLMVVPALAADSANITIEGDGASDSDVYDAYQLLTLKSSVKEGDTCEAEGKTHTTDCYNFVYSVNEKYRSVLQTVTGQTSEDDILNYISEQSTAEDTRTFADSVYNAIKAAGLDKDYYAEGTTISNVPQGYYLIAERETATDTAKSLVILNTAGYQDITVDSKAGSVPEVGKQVLEKNDSDSSVSDSYGDTADYDAGDTVTFKLTGTMPDNIDAYKQYKYVFHDTLSSTLSFDGSSSVKVKIYASKDDADNDKNGTEISSNYTVSSSNTSDGCSFEVAFSDIKQISGITKNSVVVVTYTATLADAASVTVKQDNKVHLEYSTDPYYSGDGTNEPTGETPETEVSVFTYTLVVSKTDSEGNALTGATFTLYKFDKTENDWVEVDTIEGKDSSQFTFKGLDAGKYKLSETGVPDGYNAGDDIEFWITATTNADGIESLVVTDGEGGATNLLTVKTDTSDKPTGEVDTTIENIGGNILPSTGGAGTYMLYGLGCALLVGGVALAVTKKRKMA